MAGGRGFIRELDREVLALKVEKLNLGFERAKRQFEREKGKYIEREEIKLDLAALATLLDDALTHMIHSHTTEWAKTTDPVFLVATMLEERDRVFHQFSKNKAWTVEIDERWLEEDPGEGNSGENLDPEA